MQVRLDVVDAYRQDAYHVRYQLRITHNTFNGDGGNALDNLVGFLGQCHQLRTIHET